MIKYKIGDLFETEDNTIIHCVSADFALGAGIAKEFNIRFYSREFLKSQELSPCIYQSYLTGHIFHLVTKNKYWEKPTLFSLKRSLLDLKVQCENMGLFNISSPKIASGLDRLQWNEVEEIINDIFDDRFTITVWCL